MAQYHDGTRRVAELFPETTGVGCLQEAAEVRAEKMRLLYVGLTRARLATWIVWGEARDAQRTPLAWLLHREPGAAAAAKVTTNTIAERLALLHERIPEAMAIQLATPPTQWPRLRFAGIQDPPAAAIARRALHRDWWVYSFSQLAREDTGSDAGRADDELADWPDAEYSRFSGSRFGNALHEALENIHFERWLDCEGPMPPAGELEALTSALRAHGYSGINDLDEGVPLLTKLISETVNVTLPEGTRLAQLPTQQRRNELEFHLAMAPTSVARILALLHRFGVVSARQAFGFRQRLEGLLTGRIDLVYAFEGRYFVLDYKSNRLRDYAAPGLVAAVADNEYDLQYVLYSLALHRWLRFRLGEGYDITRHLGGVRYLFCRGLDRQQAQSSGIHAVSLPPALIEQLDALLRGEPA